MKGNPFINKILSASGLNVLSAGVNIISNYLIVHFLSIEIFGEFTVFSSIIALGGLIFVIIPPNFSLFRLQDDSEFKDHLIRFYFLASLLFLIFSCVVYKFFVENVSFYLIYLFGVSTFFMSYFDVVFQAKGRVNKYFFLLLLVSLIKVFTVLFFYFIGHFSSLNDLVFSVVIAQLFVLIGCLCVDFKNFKSALSSLELLINTVLFIYENFEKFRSYYLNTLLKKIRENSIVLFFSSFLSKEIIGLFSLFLKVDSFVLGLSRNLEVLFLNRKNQELYRDEFFRNVNKFSVLLQVIYVFVGVGYMKFLAGNFYFIEIFVQSFLVYPHVYFLFARAHFLSRYNNFDINISESLYVFVCLLGYGFTSWFGIDSIYPILVTYFLAKFSLQFYMIINSKKSLNV